MLNVLQQVCNLHMRSKEDFGAHHIDVQKCLRKSEAEIELEQSDCATDCQTGRSD